MAITIEENSSLPNYADAYITLEVQSGKFSGHNALWVQSESMASFCHALVMLHQTLNGEALLESISPGKLQLKVFSCNSRGCLAIEGVIGSHLIGENQKFWHSVSFGFEFEQTQLSALLQLPWVKRYVT